MTPERQHRVSEGMVANPAEDHLGLPLVDRIGIERCRPSQIGRLRDDPGRKEHPKASSDAHRRSGGRRPEGEPPGANPRAGLLETRRVACCEEHCEAG